MSDRKSGIGKITFDRQQGSGIADGYGSETGDGYLSDVQTHQSYNPSEVSQDFYSSTKVLEQHFKDKYKFLRDAYEQRILQLSEVVNTTCENLYADELLQEMRTDKISTTFIPAHLSEVISLHLESDREQFIHTLISQLSTVKLHLLKSQEIAIQRNKSLAILEPEVLRGKKAQSGMDNLQKQLIDVKRQFDHLSSHSEGTLKALQAKNVLLEEQDRLSRENIQKILDELAIKSSTVESLQRAIDDRARDSTILETSFDRAVDDEVKLKLTPLSNERNDLSVQLNELKVQLLFKSDELLRTQDALRLKSDESRTSKSQVASIMLQVEGMLEDEATESNKTITAIHEKMKHMKARLSLELQQERRLTAVLQEEINNVRRDKEEQSRLCVIASDEAVILRERNAMELLRAADMLIKYNECNTQLMNSKARIVNIESTLQLTVDELKNVNRLKEQEIKVEAAKAKMHALQSLEKERHTIDEQVEQRTEAFKKNNESQLKALQNQMMRHSYTFGTSSQDQNKTHNMNNTLNNLNNTNNMLNNTNNTNNSDKENYKENFDSLAADISMQFAIRNFEEKSAVEKIVLESEYLINKAKAEAKMASGHKEVVKELQGKLSEAADNIGTLTQMVMRAKATEGENAANKRRNDELQSEIGLLQERTYDYQREIRTYELKIRNLENEILHVKNVHVHMQDKLSKAVHTWSIYDGAEKDRNDERIKIDEEKWKNSNERKTIDEEKIRIEFERNKIAYERRIVLEEKENIAEERKRREERENKEKNVLSRGQTEEQLLSLQKELFELNVKLTLLEIEKKEWKKEKDILMRDVAEKEKEIDDMKMKNNEKENIMMKNENKNKDYYEMDEKHSNENKNLRNVLKDTQEQAMRDHKNDALALAEMNRKFDNLMHNYEVNVTAVTERLDANEAQSQDAEEQSELINTQLNQIGILESKIIEKDGLIRTLSNDLISEQETITEHTVKNKVLMDIIAKLNILFKNQIHDLNVNIKNIKESSKKLSSFFGSEIKQISKGFMEKMLIFHSNMSRTHEENVLTMKTWLIKSHEKELKHHVKKSKSELIVMEGKYLDKMQSLSAEWERKEQVYLTEINDIKMEFNQNQRNNKNNSINNKYNSNNNDINNSTDDFDLKNRTIDDSHGSLSASILSDDHTPAYESVMRGILSALNLSGLLSQAEEREVILLATENNQPSLIAAASAKRMTADCLSHMLQEVKKLRSEIIHLPNELKFEINESQREKENNQNSLNNSINNTHPRDRTPSCLNTVDFSEINSVSTSSKAFDVAVGELEQSRYEQNMLLDLARIESDAEIRNLMSQIEELQIQKEMEVTNVRTESIELEKILITSFREESEAYKRESTTALESAKKELKYEQTRRQQLQVHLTESETELLNKIQILEEVNIRLQNRADQADLESTRIKMETLHTNVSQKS